MRRSRPGAVPRGNPTPLAPQPFAVQQPSPCQLAREVCALQELDRLLIQGVSMRILSHERVAPMPET